MNKTKHNLLKISVVTISYNSEKVIERTIESVLNQTHSNLEYILVDGASKDNTPKIIKSYEDLAKTNGIIYKWISEPDKGIYDALNKGISEATGEYVICMNSGDCFYSIDVISSIFYNLKGSPDIIYGNHINPLKPNSVIFPRSLELFWKGMPFNHQAAFVKTSLHKRHLFDLSYKVSAVHDIFWYWHIQNKVFTYVDTVISSYDFNGISATSKLWFYENFLINKKYKKKTLFIVFISLLIRAIKREIKLFSKQVIR